MPSSVEYINPEGTAPAQGLYSHIGRAGAGNLMFIAGQLSVKQAGGIIGANDFEAQYRQVFSNMRDVLDGVGLSFRNVVKFTTIFTRAQDIELFVSRDVRRRRFPAEHDPRGQPPREAGVPVGSGSHRRYGMSIK